MAAPSYTEDLTDITLAVSTTNWDESTDGGWDDGGTIASDSDYGYIQGTEAVNQIMTKAAVTSLIFNNGAGITVPTDGAYFIWHTFNPGTALQTYANGGMRVIVGSGLGAFYAWDVGGSDFARNPYGGWTNHAVNPTVTADDTVGSPTTTEQYIGVAVSTSAGIAKGYPHSVDAMRYGRGSSIFEFGDLGNGYCTFDGFATQNDNSSNRWGLIQKQAGGYLYKGKMTLGTATNACDFRDSDTSILIDDTPKVTANFNTIEVNNASSRIDWTNVKFTALGTTSPGRLVCNANADLNWDGCQFTDMGDFTFGGTNSEALNTIWAGCGQITPAGGNISGSSVSGYEGTSDTSAVIYNVAADPNGELDNMSITKGSASTHAIEFGTSSPLTMTLTGIDFSGYNAANGQTDSTFHVKRTTGTVTINISGGSGNVSYKSDGATVVIVQNPVALTVTCQDQISKAAIEGAAVTITAATGGVTGYYDQTVTITRSGTTATVAHTAHPYKVGNKVAISGADQNEYNRIKTITAVAANSYDFEVAGSPTTPATGTIKATAVIIDGLTNASGIISDTRTYSVDQPFTGFAKKGSTPPTYVSNPLSGSVDKDSGTSVTALMIPD